MHWLLYWARDYDKQYCQVSEHTQYEWEDRRTELENPHTLKLCLMDSNLLSNHHF